MTTDHDAAEYGRLVAAQYDDFYDGAFDTDGAVACLSELAAGGSILELGVGTGRIALPLVARGHEVHGVDGSAEMLELLAGKPGGDKIATTLGDFAEVEIPGRFTVAALLVNTIFALPDQAAQVRCFANVARHLEPGGRFVVETWVPETSPQVTSRLSTRQLSPGYFGLVASEHDPSRQVLSTLQAVLGDGVVRVFPVVHRYVHPAELDLMARLAGMALEDRWEDWHRTPFGPRSLNHVSVYRMPGGDGTTAS
jgi:SAM-dependent methyltransferase